MPQSASQRGDTPLRPPAPKQARAHKSRAKLLEAAAEVIAERGYRDATLAEIARRAGYSHGLITQRFGSKEGMLDQLLEDHTRSWQERELRPAQGGATGAESVAALLTAQRLTIRKDPAVARSFCGLLFEALRPVPLLAERVRDLHREHRRAITKAVANGIDDGSVRAGVDPAAVADVVMAGMRGAVYLWMLDPDFDIDGTLQALSAQTEEILSP